MSKFKTLDNHIGFVWVVNTKYTNVIICFKFKSVESWSLLCCNKRL